MNEEIELWEQEIADSIRREEALKEASIYNFYGEVEYLFSEDTFIDEAFDIKTIIKTVWDKFIGLVKKIREWIRKAIKYVKGFFAKLFGKNTNNSDDENSNGTSNNGKQPDNTSKNSNNTVDNKKESKPEKFNGYIPQKQQDDFEKLMKIGEARNIKNSYDVVRYYMDILDEPDKFDKDKLGGHSIKRTPDSRANFNGQFAGNGEGNLATLKFDIDRINDDLEDTINAINNSKEYERLKANEYEKTNMNKVNFRNIISMLEETDKELSKFESSLEDIKKKFDGIKEEDKAIPLIKQYQSDMTKFCKNHIDYYKARIGIVNTFIKSFRVSKEELQKINSKSKKQFDITNKNILTSFTADQKYKKLYTRDQKEYDELMRLMREMKDANDERNWGTYRKLFLDFMRVFGVSQAGGINVNVAFDGITNGAAQFSVLKQNYRKIPIGSKTLYHQDEKGKTELVPYAVINGGRRFCPEPLVYAHLSTISNRYHQPISREDRRDRAIYKITAPIDEVYQDTEMHMGNAVIIRTDKILKLEEVDIDKYLEDKNAFNVPQRYRQNNSGGWSPEFDA